MENSKPKGGLVVAETSSAADTHVRIAETMPDLVIMDLDLPGADGIVAIADTHRR